MAGSFCSRCSNVARNAFSANACGIKKTVVRKRFYVSDFDVTRDVLNSKAPDHKGQKNHLFERNDVQDILKRLTGFDLNIIFKPRKMPLELPKYQVMTEQEIKREEEKAKAEGERRLKMPDVMSKRKPINIQLNINPELIDMDEDGADYIFTDISTSKDRNNRAVLVRENATGILREGSWDERDRMEFMYWPKEGQHHEILPMLQDQYLPAVFEQNRHLDVLDIINIQCSPDAPDYIRVHERVYHDIDERQLYEMLHSTCYYGGMVFFFVKNNKFHSFLNFLLENKRIHDAVDLIKLYSIVHSVAAKSDGISLLKEYLSEHKLMNSFDLLLKATEGKKAISA